jgi:anaerobic ribonucleoside-triphosphate reductase activating protein
MNEYTLIIDPQSGDLTIEGMTRSESLSLLPELGDTAQMVNCGRPLNTMPLTLAGPASDPVDSTQSMQVYRIYHNSVVDGPGIRSVVQVSGCSIRCRSCYVPQTHDPNVGVNLSITEIVKLVLDKEGEPRDGVTILGGEPFDQPIGLLALTQELKARGQHLTIYTGYTIEALKDRNIPQMNETLALADLLIDGPFLLEQSEGAGEWRGSRNQRIIQLNLNSSPS